MQISFLPLAKRELYRAADWYDRRQTGLSDRLYAEVDAALALVRQMPNAHPPIEGGARRVLLSTFPYALIFVRDGPDVLVLAFAHNKRRPSYWRRRAQRASN